MTPLLPATEVIKAHRPGFSPSIGLISGYNPALLPLIESPSFLPYHVLPGFPESAIEGHQTQLVLGYFSGQPIVWLQGRAHSYETQSYQPVKTYIRTLKQIGCETLIATNASGSLRPEVGPGSLVLITDHINFQPGNPLAGPNDPEFGPRFPALDPAYHPAVNAAIREAAFQMKVELFEGVYLSLLGPSYETAAEIRAFKQWGADVVGMSTVPEVILANHCGLRVAVIACITNWATGLSPVAHTHSQVCTAAQLYSGPLTAILQATCLALGASSNG